MPICTWCGIDSKNELVCDWCKRPLSLRNSRTTSVGGKSGIDLLADEDESVTVLPKVIAAGVVVFLCAAVAVVFGVANMNKQPEAPVATASAPPAPVKEVFTSDRIAQTGTVQASYVPPPPRVFLPPNVNTVADAFRTTSVEAGVETHALVKLDKETKAPQFGISGAKLTNSKKPNGEMVCYGSVKIFNTSIDNIVDFDIYLVSGKSKYLVKPFIGTLENMEPLLTHVVHAKEALTLPVVVDKYKGDPGTVEGRLVVVATLDSTPKQQLFETSLGKPAPNPAPKDRKR